MNRSNSATLLGALIAMLHQTPAPAHEYRIGDIEIAHPWSRATPPAAKVGGGYVTIENKGTAADRLVSVTMERAGRVEIHEMSVTDGIMRMREWPDGIALPARQTISLKPGGFHVMFMDLQRPLKQGERLAGTLIFERAGTIAVEFAVEAVGAAAAPSVHAH